MSHWQQEPIRYLDTLTPQPSETIRSMKRKIEQYQIRFRQQQDQIQRMSSKLQQKDAIIKHLQHQNWQLRSQMGPKKEDRRMDDSIHQLSNVNETEYNVKNRLNRQDIKMFKVSQLQRDKTNKSADREKSVRKSTVQAAIKGKLGEGNARNSTPEMRTVSKSRSKPSQFKIMENFLVVQGNLLQLGQGAIDPLVTCIYPNYLPSDRQKIVPMFCYPRGVECRVLLTQQEVNQVLQDGEMQSSIFLLNSEFTTTGAMETQITNQAVSIANPNFNLYGVCLRGKAVAQSGAVNYQLSKTYVILTYFPFVRFFLNLLAMTTNAIKMEEMMTPKGGVPNIQRIILKSFQDLEKISINRLPTTIKFRCQENNLNLSIPEPPYTDSLTSSYAIQCVPKVDLDMLVDLVLMMLLEYSIVIYSKDLTLLSQLILFVIQAIQPLRYPHPIIVNLPKQMQILLESPFPTLIGTTIPLDQIQPHSVYFNVDQKRVQNRPQLPQLRQISQYIRSQVKPKSSQSDVLHKIKQKVRDDILTPTVREKQSHHSLVLQLFRKTQIYKYYCQ